MSDTKIEVGNVVWLPGSPEQKMTVLAVEEHRVHCAWINTAREVEYFDGPIAALTIEKSESTADLQRALVDLQEVFNESAQSHGALSEENQRTTEQLRAALAEIQRRDLEAKEAVKIAHAVGAPSHGVSEIGKLALWFAQRYEVLKREGNEQIVALQSQLAEARSMQVG